MTRSGSAPHLKDVNNAFLVSAGKHTIRNIRAQAKVEGGARPVFREWVDLELMVRGSSPPTDCGSAPVAVALNPAPRTNYPEQTH